MRPDQQFAHLAVRHRAVLRVAHAQLEPRPRLAAAARFGQPGAGAQGAGDFSHVVDRVQVHAETRLECRGVFPERHDECLLQGVLAVARRRRLFEQEVGHDAQQQHHRTLGIADRVPELGRAELRHHGDRSAVGQHRVHVQRAAAVENRARDHAAIIRGDAIEGVRPHGVELHGSIGASVASRSAAGSPAPSTNAANDTPGGAAGGASPSPVSSTRVSAPGDSACKRSTSARCASINEAWAFSSTCSSGRPRSAVFRGTYTAPR
ncbi:hypothetical protein G6F22_015552 [Rhizopus arrhizus]|nr:hypothetical protein G6F22_015552 [Rhizopus arrhizus]